MSKQLTYSFAQNSKLFILKNMCEKDTNAYHLASEMLKNMGNYTSCCNPICRKYITFKQSMIFDSVFCSDECSKIAEELLMDKWLLC